MKFEDQHDCNDILDDMEISKEYEVVRRDGALYLQRNRKGNKFAGRAHINWAYAIALMFTTKRYALWDYRLLVATERMPRVKAMDIAELRAGASKNTEAMEFVNGLMDVLVDFLGP